MTEKNGFAKNNNLDSITASQGLCGYALNDRKSTASQKMTKTPTCHSERSFSLVKNEAKNLARSA